MIIRDDLAIGLSNNNNDKLNIDVFSFLQYIKCSCL